VPPDSRAWLYINSKSGRYSSDYFNTKELLENAKKRFELYFPERFHIEEQAY